LAWLGLQPRPPRGYYAAVNNKIKRRFRKIAIYFGFRTEMPNIWTAVLWVKLHVPTYKFWGRATGPHAAAALTALSRATRFIPGHQP